MGCPSIACSWAGTCLIACKREGHSVGSLYGRFSFHCQNSLRVWPSLSMIPAKSLLPVLASQEGLGSSYNGIDEGDLWQRVQLLQRLLDVSIAEENYSHAKQVHDQLSALKAQLSEAEQSMLGNVRFLARESISDKLEAISVLGEMGDARVLPMLANGLLDSNLLVAAETEKAMWKIFMRSGKKHVDQHLEKGLSFMLVNDLTRARDAFAKVIEMAPSFAEGWNKRATVNYFLQEYQASIEDCEQTLELNPYHFGALSGMGLCYAALNDSEMALQCFEKAYALHPGLKQISKFINILKQKLSESKWGEDTNERDRPQET